MHPEVLKLGIYKYDIRKLSDDEYNKWFSLMSEEKQAKVNRFYFDDDRKRTVAGEMLARKAVAKRCGVSEESIVFGKNENGKPFAQNLDVQFNISHSEDMVVCVVADNPVGIDVEKIRQIDLKVAKRVYTQDEIDYLYGGDETAILERFFELWTAKEAYLKFLGCGIVDKLNEMYVNTENVLVQKDGEYIISIYSEK